MTWSYKACYMEPCLKAGENGKYKAELRVRHVLSYHKCGLKRKENTIEVFFPISLHIALKSQGKGSSPSCNSLSHISITKKLHTKLMKFLSVTLFKCVLLFTGCLGDFVRLASYLAQVLHLVMHIPLWHITGDRQHISECIEKKPTQNWKTTGAYASML